MIFILNERIYKGETAVEIARLMETDCIGYGRKTGKLRDFLVWTLESMSDRIPPRELDVSPDLDDETIAFNFLCLLDGLQIGALDTQSNPDADPADRENRVAESL